MLSHIQNNALHGLVAVVFFIWVVIRRNKTNCFLHCLCIGSGLHHCICNCCTQNWVWPPVVFRHFLLHSFQKGWWWLRATQHLGIVHRDLTLDCSLQKYYTFRTVDIFVWKRILPKVATYLDPPQIVSFSVLQF